MGSRFRTRKDPGTARSTAPPTLSVRAFLIAAPVLLLVISAVYLPSLNFKFILDDHHFLADPRIQSSGHVWEYFANYVWAQFTGGPPSFYRPLFLVWLRLNFVLSETSTWGWHLLSLVRHLLVATSLGLLVWILLRDRAAVLLAAGLFALHPSHTESVAWVTVPDPLMALATLLSLTLFTIYMRNDSLPGAAGRTAGRSRKKKRPEPTSSVIWLLASGAACFAALLTKETAVILPPIVFIVAVVASSSNIREVGTTQLGRIFPYGIVSGLKQIVPFVCVTLVYFLLRFHALGGRLVPATQHLSTKTLLLSWPAALWFYVKVLLWPVRLRAYADSDIIERFSLRAVLLPAVGVVFVILVLAAVVWWTWAKNRDSGGALGVTRALLLGVSLLVFPILPALNLNALNPGDFLHGRYMYLPIAGLALIVAAAWHVAGKGQAYILLSAGVLIVVFAALTFQQVPAWKDDLSLFTTAHEVAPGNAPVALSFARARVQMAIGLDEAGQCDAALPIFQEVTREYPQDWFAWAGLGDCFVQFNQLQSAEAALHRAADLSQNPHVVEQWQQVRAKLMGTVPSSRIR